MSPDTLIAYLCAELVGGDYAIHVTEGEATVLIELTAPSASMPCLVGRRGQMVHALQALAIAAGRKHGVWVYLTLDEQRRRD